MIVDREALVAQAKAERRRYQRVQVNLGGRLFVPGDGREGKCRIVAMSATGAQVISPIIPEKGVQVILYVDGFGRFEAEIMRHEEGEFAAQFRCSALKQERVAEQLAEIMTSGVVDEPKLRRHERVATQGIAHFTRTNGDTVDCEVIDLSLSGASLKTDTRPRIGEEIMVGQMSGRVVRHHETGIGVEFSRAPAEKQPIPLRRLQR
jgi:hypothetical protein